MCSCMHEFTRCAKSRLNEWDSHDESVWVSDLSGFKELSEWEATLTYPNGVVPVWCERRWGGGKGKWVKDRLTHRQIETWRQEAETLRVLRGWRQNARLIPLWRAFWFAALLCGTFHCLWVIKTSYIMQLTCPLRLLGNSKTAWHWSVSLQR